MEAAAAMAAVDGRAGAGKKLFSYLIVHSPIRLSNLIFLPHDCWLGRRRLPSLGFGRSAQKGGAGCSVDACAGASAIVGVGELTTSRRRRLARHLGRGHRNGRRRRRIEERGSRRRQGRRRGRGRRRPERWS